MDKNENLQNTASHKMSGWMALSPLIVFLCLYLVTSIIVNDFYKIPITVAFLVSSGYAILITRDVKLEKRVERFSKGASDKNILLMVWIFILAGAFAESAKQMGAIDATVNLTLNVLPGNLLLAGLFLLPALSPYQLELVWEPSWPSLPLLSDWHKRQASTCR
jgi:Na+/H+ antiporter NhaC